MTALLEEFPDETIRLTMDGWVGWRKRNQQNRSVGQVNSENQRRELVMNGIELARLEDKQEYTFLSFKVHVNNTYLQGCTRRHCVRRRQ